MKVSKRSDIAPFYAMEILKSANEMADDGATIMHMEAGEPGSGAPAKVLQAAHAALDNCQLGYTESEGDPVLRARIAQHYQDYYGRTVAPEQIARLTERFHRGNHPQGSGLGLSIVEAIATRAGGSLRLFSGDGIGLRVTLSLPLA